MGRSKGLSELNAKFKASPYYHPKPFSPFRGSAKANHQILNRTHQRMRRLQILRRMGGRCVCCCEDRLEFLHVDHVKGDGAEHRTNLKKMHRTLWTDLEESGYPKDRFQLLCANCNLAKRKNLYCPHQYTFTGVEGN